MKKKPTTTAIENRFRIAIFGSARIKKGQQRYNLIYNLAKEIAEQGIDIVTGGGPGLVDVASRGQHAGRKNKNINTVSLTLPPPHTPTQPHSKDESEPEFRKPGHTPPVLWATAVPDIDQMPVIGSRSRHVLHCSRNEHTGVLGEGGSPTRTDEILPRLYHPTRSQCRKNVYDRPLGGVRRPHLGESRVRPANNETHSSDHQWSRTELAPAIRISSE